MRVRMLGQLKKGRLNLEYPFSKIGKVSISWEFPGWLRVESYSWRYFASEIGLAVMGNCHQLHWWVLFHIIQWNTPMVILSLPLRSFCKYQASFFASSMTMLLTALDKWLQNNRATEHMGSGVYIGVLWNYSKIAFYELFLLSYP